MGTERPTTPQSITVEYIVTEELDGTTLAPEIIIDQTSADKTPFDTKAQIFRPKAVPKLGLIDPDLMIGGSIGARCIPFFSLDTEAVAAPGAALDLVGIREDQSQFFQKLVQAFGGPGPFYLDDGFNVAQGSDMRLGGFAAPPGEPIRVRLTILVPATCLDIAAFRCPCPDGVDGVEALELMVGPADFRGNDPGVESLVVSRSIGGLDFNAFRVSPDPGPPASTARWSYTLPRRQPPVGRYSITLALEYSDVEPAPSFAGLLGVGLSDQPNDLGAVVFPAAANVQVQSVGNDNGELLSVLEWEFSNPEGKPFVTCVLTKPAAPGIIYLYQATIRFLGA